MIYWLIKTNKEKKLATETLKRILKEMELNYQTYLENKIGNYIIDNKIDSQKFNKLKNELFLIVKPHIEALVNFINTKKTDVNILSTEYKTFAELAVLTETLLKSKNNYDEIKNKVEQLVRYSIDADLSKRYLFLSET